MKFFLYQLRDMRDTAYGFMRWDFAKEHGFNLADYEQVYVAERNYTGLDEMFEEFNCNHPADFKGHSLSVSDIVATENNGELKYFYCDSFGWVDVTATTQPTVVAPAKEEKPKRIWTEEEVKTLIQSNDKVLYGGLLKLYECQTAEEQSVGATTENNGYGFNGVDSPILSSFAEFLKKHGYLSDKQKAIARKKLVKYNKQLTKLANN